MVLVRTIALVFLLGRPAPRACLLSVPLSLWLGVPKADHIRSIEEPHPLPAAAYLAQPSKLISWERIPVPLLFVLLAPVLFLLTILAVFEAATMGKLEDRC